jgi:coenzyme F420-reducing hydrogenase delta subunit
MAKEVFMPKIIGFLCNWCSYAGADLAGVSRYQYPPAIRTIRVMCSGRVDPGLIFESYIQGADAVFVGGCHIGDCHYLEGNYYAERKIKMTMKLLEKTGLEPGRLRLEWVSASEGERFASIMNEFVGQVQELGPSPIAGSEPNQDILTNIKAAQATVNDFRLRAIVSKEWKIVERGNVYDIKKSQEDFDAFMEDALNVEFTRNQIMVLLNEGPLTVKDISAKLNKPTDVILDNLVILRKNNQVALQSIENFTPKYVSLVVGGD